MNIFRKIKESIYSPSFYASVKTDPANHSISYFFKFHLLVSLLFTIILGTTISVAIFVNTTSEKVAEIASLYPRELVVTIMDGRISTNVDNPYNIAFPSDSKTKDTPLNFLVFDTDTVFDIDKFDQYDTTALITDKYLVVREERAGKLSVYDVSGIPDMMIDQITVTSFLNKMAPIVRWMIPLVYLLMFLVTFFLWILFNTISICLWGAVYWVISKIIGNKFTYSESLKLSIHALTLATLFNTIAIFIGYPINFFLYGAIILAVLYINTGRKNQGEVSST